MRKYALVDGKLSPEDIERVIAETVAEQRLEGLTVTDEEVGKLRAHLSGEITLDDYMAWVRESVTA